MEPIATYRERQWGFRRDLTLFPDHVRVEARWIDGRRATDRVRLASLDPAWFTLTRRHPWCRAAIALTLVAGGFAALIHYGRLLDALPGWSLWLAVGVAAAGILMAVATFPMTEYARFRAAGRPEVVLFDVARAGPDRDRFDRFVEQVIERIDFARTAAAGVRA